MTVYGNVVEGNWNGIVGLHGDRGTGAHGVRELRNLYVHDNVVGMEYHPDGIGPHGERGVAAMTGVVQNAGIDFVFDDAYGNRFEANHYTVSTMAERHFSWANARMDFARWQGYDHDLTGAAQSRGGDGAGRSLNTARRHPRPGRGRRSRGSRPQPAFGTGDRELGPDMLRPPCSIRPR